MFLCVETILKIENEVWGFSASIMSPGEGNGNPLQYSCLENPTDGGAWWATLAHGVAKSRTRLSDFTFTFTSCPQVSVAQSCRTLCDPLGCSPPGSSVPGVLQARILEWVAVSFSRGSSQPRNQTQVSCMVGRFYTVWATREASCPHRVFYLSLNLCICQILNWLISCHSSIYCGRRERSSKIVDSVYFKKQKK